jgi:hypothetical protein
MSEEKIKGISEFCDGWCEHCAFTARCADYVEGRKSLHEKHEANPMLTARVKANVEKAMHWLGKLAEGNPTTQAITETKNVLRSDKDLASLASHYADLAQDWLKSQPGMMDRLQSLITDLTIGLESVESIRTKTESIKNSLALIQWNATHIQSKVSDALFLVKIGDEKFVGERYTGMRSHGVLKSVLVAIDQSIEAWKIIFDLLADREDDFLDILAQLQKIRDAINEQFPEAANFKRPGFDD